MAKFEKVQLEILNSKSKNQLVSAGAGSGKTTVMIEKIANLIINDKIDIDSLLVVTFTVLAGEEMKTRLIDKLNEVLSQTNEKEQILELISKVKTASIDTIDGFSSKTIKKYFYELNISPNIEIVSDATKDYYLTLAMKRTIDKLSSDIEKANLMLDFYGGNRRNFEQLQEMILDVYYNIINIEDYESFLTKSRDEYLNGELCQNIILQKIIDRVEKLKLSLIHTDRNLSSELISRIDNYYDSLNKFNNNLNLKANLIELNKCDIEAFSKKEYNEYPQLINLNKEISNFNNLKSALTKNGIDENFDIKNEKIIAYYDIFNEILRDFIKNYQKLKENNNLIDFNDLNRLMLKLLKNDRVRAELQAKYRYIFIDEYQDVNPLQDSLMSALVNENTHLFTVGDVKQSIYAFRGASPEWFLKKYDVYAKNPTLGTKYDMNINFRSNPIILQFINEIFSKLMTKASSGIDYLTDALIEPKRDDIIDDKVKIILTKEAENKSKASGLYSVKSHALENEPLECDYEDMSVVNEISKLINSEFYDSKTRTYRKLRYSDIAILSRTEKDDKTQNLIELLKIYNIPVNSNNKLDIHNSEGVRLILSILKCVENIGDDTDYFATFMALSDMTIDDFVSIRNVDDSLYENLLEHKDNLAKKGFINIEKIKNAHLTKTNTELIRFILNEIRLRYYLLLKPDGEKELQLIDEFLQKISIVENNLDLTEFIAVVESNVSNNTDFTSEDRVDSVTVQTIHKSKGLEYPVVILYNASKQYGFINENSAINFNRDIGLGLDYFDVANRTKSPSLVKYAIKLENMDKGYREELRLLYVALTRAKNKLIITGSYTDKLFDEDKDVSKNNFMNTILSCFKDRISECHNEFENCTIDFYDKVEDLASSKETRVNEIQFLNPNFKYANTDKFNIPFKNTVTGLNSQENERTSFVTKQQLRQEIQLLDQEDRAVVGTHYHKTLEKLDFLLPYEQNTEFEDVDYKKIEKAHKTLSVLVKNSVAIKKEAEFMMYVPYNQLVSSELTDKVLVQGVVDLIIEYENDITIVDYKFSKLNANILKQKYKEQLNLYKLAVEKAYKKPVNKMLIYSIETGELV